MDLRETLRRRQVNAMVADAEFLRQQPESDERDELLTIERRRAMYRFALSQITLTERDVILGILRGAGLMGDAGTDRSSKRKS